MTDIHLFIGTQEVEFTNPPEILFTYEADELTNPTLVKNSFTKQITVDGTKSNNDIFGHFWKLDRYSRQIREGGIGSDFNPMQKVPFSLYNGSDLYETGYVKLDNVRTNNAKTEYDITLFGGLGLFLSNLAYRPDGNQKKLSDLQFIDGSESELDFQINRDTVLSAWTATSADTLWNIINFAPVYNGCPDNFTADKVLVDISSTNLASSTTVEGVTYRPYNGYGVLSLDNKLTEWETRDLRSYLQRPVLNVKKTLEAICDPVNNGGYEVELDEDFFSSGNPDYNDTWMTLPLLSEIEYNPSEEATGTIAIGDSGGSQYVMDYELDINSNIPLSQFTVTFDLSAGEGSQALYTSYVIEDSQHKIRMFNGITVQLVGYDADGNFVTASDIMHFCSSEKGYRPSIDTYPANTMYGVTNKVVDYNTAGTSNVIEKDGFFRYNLGNLKWVNRDLTPNELTLYNVESVASVAMVVRRSAYFIGYYPSEAGRLYLYDIQGNFEQKDITPINLGIKIEKMTPDGIRTNSIVTKKMLLDTNYSPADFLLSYIKLFGLHLWKSPTNNTIYITKRDNFYLNTTIDINDLIHRGKDEKVKPLVADKKWYDFRMEEVKGTFAKQYEDTTEMHYGMKRVDTNYNFNAETKNLYEGNIFRTAVECSEKSQFFNKSLGNNLPYYFGNNFKYSLYNAGESSDVAVTNSYNLAQLSPYKFFDFMPKVQLHSEENKSEDGSQVLLYYRGLKGTYATDGQPFTYILSDDLTEMYGLVDGPCYLYTTNSGVAKQLTWLPQYSRYIADDRGNITSSLDFGQPRQIYTKSYTINEATEESTIFNRYWKRYCEDLYDKNTRTVELSVLIRPWGETSGYLLGGSPNPEWLRYFFWFDDSIWRINGIYDWNPTSNDTTKMTFVKVQDISNYTTDEAPDFPPVKTFYLIPSIPSLSVNQQGGQYLITVDANQSWSATTSLGTLSTSAGTGNTVVTVSGVTTTEYGQTTLTLPNYYTESDYSSARTIVVTFSGANGEIKTLELTQEPWMPRITATPDYILLPYTGGTKRITINKRDCPGAVLFFNKDDEDQYWPVEGDGVNLTNAGIINGARWDTSVFMAFGGNAGDSITASNGVFSFSGVTSGAVEVPFAVVQLPEYFTLNREGRSTVTNDTLCFELQFDDKVELVSYPQWVMPLSFSEWNSMTEYEQTIKRNQIAAFVQTQYFSVPESAGQVMLYATPLSGSTRIGQRSNLLTFFDGTDQITVQIIQRGTNRRTAPGYEDDEEMTGDTTTYVVSGTDICFDGSGESHYVNLYGGEGYSLDTEYTVGKYNTNNVSSDWLLVDTGVDPTQLLITARPNFEYWSGSPMTYMPRIAYLYVTNANTEQTIVCRQGALRAGSGAYLIIDEDEFDPNPSGTPSTTTLYKEVDYTGETFTFDYISSSPISISSSTEWITYEISGGSISITVDPNAIEEGRTGTVTITNEDGITRVIIIDQAQMVHIPNYFRTISQVDNNTISFRFTTDASTYLAYSTDEGATWTTVTTSGTIPVSCNSGDTIYWKGIGERISSTGSVPYTKFESTGNFMVSGNAMSLLYADECDSATTMSPWALKGLFYFCTGLTDASELVLPVKTLSRGCYQDMFVGCTGLTSAPDLPATTLAEQCYTAMFKMCSGLTVAPEISATTVALEACYEMFTECRSLTTGPSILPATDLSGGTSCYFSMFSNCSSLVTPPVLPATTLSVDCYDCMFSGCTSLANAPALPATNLTKKCYTYMFDKCTSLRTAPVLPATILAEMCYYRMFLNCNLLNNVTCLAIDRGASNCTTDWLYGVGYNGTLTKNQATTWAFGPSGAPFTWTVIDYEP